MGVDITLTMPPKIYVNWDCDVICALVQYGYFGDFKTKPIEYVAVSTETVGYVDKDFSKLLSNPTLEEIWLYPDRERLVELRLQAFDADEPFRLDFVSLKEADNNKRDLLLHNAGINYEDQDLDSAEAETLRCMKNSKMSVALLGIYCSLNEA
jgi:hypothetical protein